MSHLTALAVTIGIEIPVVMIVAWLWRSRVDADWPTIIAVTAAASLLTHPFAWYFNGVLAEMAGFAVRATVIETFVILAEMIVLALFARMAWRTALTASLLANMASFGAGLFWFYFLQ